MACRHTAAQDGRYCRDVCLWSAAVPSNAHMKQQLQRFWNEHAGSLTLDAMESLFQPVPFGEVRESVLEKISTPENAPIWDMFRTIDPDKQHKVLLVSSPYSKTKQALAHHLMMRFCDLMAKERELVVHFVMQFSCPKSI